MQNNTAYYRQNARSFFESTVNVDMSTLYAAFLSKLPAQARILDAGCGSGRDAKAFSELGHAVSAFDAAVDLAQLASEYCGFDVAARSFSDITEVDAYDGIWCCASLLHVPAAEMVSTLQGVWRALRTGGCFYASFKLGKGERDDGGRHFTDADDATLRRWLDELPNVAAIETWITADQRPDRSERWLNALVVREPAPVRKLVTGGDDPFLPHLSQAMARATEIDIAVAFIKTTGMRLLMPDLLAAMLPSSEHGQPRRRIRVLTSDYLDVTDPEALRLLSLLQDQGGEVRVYVTQGTSFHLKAYVFAKTSANELIEGTAFIGSSNISRQALQDGLEWNYRVAYPSDRGFLEARQRFEELFAHPRTVALTDRWIESYEVRRIPPPRARSGSVCAPVGYEDDAGSQPKLAQRRPNDEV
jgi:HKD family nuclease